jgi:hypothetical protein
MRKPSDYVKARRERITQILDTLEDHPLTLDEMIKIAYKDVTSKKISYESKKRTLRRYIADLKAWKIIEFKKGRYFFTRSRRKFTKNDYDLVSKHSRQLLLENEDIEEFDDSYKETPAYCILQALVHMSGQLSISCLSRHFKTGYYNEIWLPLQSYHALMKEYDYPVLPRNGPTISIGVMDVIPEEWRQKEANFQKKRIPEETLTRLFNVETQLLSQIQDLTFNIQNGAILEGSCQACPTKQILITS